MMAIGGVFLLVGPPSISAAFFFAISYVDSWDLCFTNIDGMRVVTGGTWVVFTDCTRVLTDFKRLLIFSY